MATVLLISRDRRVRDAIGRLLRGRGHTLRVHPCIDTPVRDWLGCAWDVAFFDLSAAGATGLTAVGLTAARRPTRLIAVIERGGRPPGLDRMAEAVRLGAEEFMSKPIDRLDAEALLERLPL